MAKHLMLDFETLGNKPDTAVLSLGAVLFDKEKFIKEQLWIFNITGQLHGNRRSINPDTLLWWMDQNEKAKTIFNKTKTEGILLKDFVADFRAKFFLDSGSDVRVWGNGATFDVSIVENIHSQIGADPFWKFWNIRCYRTLKQTLKIENSVPREGTHHDALDDAKYQAKCLMELFKKQSQFDA